MSVFGATVGTYKISGYVEPDFVSTNSMVKAGFKVEIVGTSYFDVTDNNGYYELLNIPIATSINVKIRFSKAGYLRKEISDLTISSEVLIGTKDTPVKMWPGDLPINNIQDDTINFIDVLQMAKCYNSIYNEIKYNKNCDFNLDDAVNVADVFIMAKHFNAVPNTYGTEKVSYVAPDRPGAPQNLKALWYTGATASLSWEAPLTKATSISGYEVYFNDKVIATAKTTNIICTGLNPNRENTVYVKSIDGSGVRSDSSNILRITTPADDHGNALDKATPIECEKEVIASMETNDTVDYFKFKPQTSGTYVFKMYVGFILKEYLYDSNGTKIADITAGRQYYIGVENECTSDEYRFIIRQVSNKPDLVAENLFVNNLWVDEPNLLSVKIKNIGDSTSNGLLRVSFDVDGQKNVFWADYNFEITPDSSDTCTVTGSSIGTLTWTPTTVGHHKITVHIDVNNNINEIFENNNSVTYDIVLDDYPDNKENSKEIQIGKEVTGYIGTKEDKDYFYTIPKVSGNYHIEMPGSRYTNFFIYNKNMVQVTPTGVTYIDTSREGCYVNANLTANEKYYIVVKTADTANFVSEQYTIRSNKVN
jgi:hypothetical protein